MSGGAWARTLELLPYISEVMGLGLIVTVQITVGGFILAFLLGLLLAFIQLSPHRLPRIMAGVYIEVFRGIPVLTQLFIIYFGLSQFGLKLAPLTAAMIGFGLNGSAYLAEIFRAGIAAVDKGQFEASASIGMPKLMALRIIILPQAIRVVLPPLGNFAISLLKDSSIASAIAAPELAFRTRMLVSETLLAPQLYLILAAVYLVVSLGLVLIIRGLETRMRQSRQVL
jgi:polar amino acid transport system permease protein/cystine transport system permease protein